MNDGGPVFPTEDYISPFGERRTATRGMSLRAYIATKAMAGMLTSGTHWDEFEDELTYSKLAVKYADALIAELNKEPLP